MTNTLLRDAIQYGAASLPDVLPSALAALGVPNEPNTLGLDPTESLVVVLVDGLGWNLLRAHADAAPFLSGLQARPLTVGFPTTTATSLTSLGTGLTPGVHGLTGYTSRVEGVDEAVNWLRWETARSGRSLLEQLVPEELQPHRTAFERAEAAGVEVSVVTHHSFRKSGLTRAALRGGTFVASYTAADAIAAVATAARGRRPNLGYCYNGDLDLVGHVHGCESEAWRIQLALLDRVLEMIATRLPPDTRLLVTGDHGMVDVPDHAKIDYDATPALSDDVETIAGEARARYLHVPAAKLDAVLRRWRDELGDRMLIVTRDEAVAAGWFGPTVEAEVLCRIGDIVAVSTTDVAVVRQRVEPLLSRLRGQHGALTEDELLVPLLQYVA